MKRSGVVLLWMLVAVAGTPAQQVGPKSGSLVVVGGAMRDPAIVTRFIDLAGGPDAPIVIVPTAGDAETYDQYWSGLRQFRENGARNLTVLHTRDPKVADTEAFAKPLTTARGVFFGGGRQWRLADAYLNTRVQRELQAVLDRGGVIGGSSAGATILGSFLVRGDTKGNELMIGDHTVGFGFLKNTAIVVEGDRFDVIGQGYVAIYDARHATRPPAKFYLMSPGDRFDLMKREAGRRADEYRPLENVGAQQPPAKPDHMQHRFDDPERFAKSFDDPARDAWQMPDRVISALGLRRDSVVADVGAGTGYFSVRLAKAVPAGTVYAVDVEHAMLEHIRKRATAEGLKNLEPVHATSTSPNLPKPADVVLIVDTYHHLPNRATYFADLRKSLAPGGRVAIVDFRKDSPEGPPREFRFDAAQIVDEMKQAGYRLEAQHDFLPRQHFLLFVPIPR